MALRGSHLSHLLLLTGDRSKLNLVEAAVRCRREPGLMLLHEVALRAGLSLLELCRVQLIVFDPDLSEGKLYAALGALRRRSSSPIILFGRLTGEGSRRMLIRLPRGVHAMVGRDDATGLRRAVESALARL